MDYPERPPYFANRVIRLMTKTCAANEIGLDAVMLVIVIASTEDAKRYKGAVTFYNGQLIPITGLNNWHRLDRARKAAIGAGWLHYEGPPRGDRKPGRYWATIPEYLSDLDDSPSDENHPSGQRGYDSFVAGYCSGFSDAAQNQPSDIERSWSKWSKNDHTVDSIQCRSNTQNDSLIVSSADQTSINPTINHPSTVLSNVHQPYELSNLTLFPIPNTSADEPRAASPKEKKSSWVTPYLDAWEEIYQGSPDVGPFLAHLNDLHNKHGPDEVVPRLKCYLGSVEPQFASLPKFKASYGTWDPEKRKAIRNGNDKGRFRSDSGAVQEKLQRKLAESAANVAHVENGTFSQPGGT